MATKTLSELSMKNVQFTKLVKAEGSLREFNFRKKITEGRIIFNVDVTDDRANRIFFEMEKQDDVWKLHPQQLPTWITISEKDLHELIEQELQS
jgi:hypothetical protein